MSTVALKGQAREVRFEGAIWVGVDVHKRSYAVAVRDQEGRVVQFTMAADNDAFVRKVVSYGQPVAQVAYEAGPCGYSLYRVCEAAGIPALVAAPSRIPRPVTRRNKTDSLIVANLRIMPRAACWLLSAFLPRKRKCCVVCNGVVTI